MRPLTDCSRAWPSAQEIPWVFNQHEITLGEEQDTIGIVLAAFAPA